jgi:hypothetical protein
MTEAAMVGTYIRLIVRALEGANLAHLIPVVALKVTESQWRSLIREAEKFSPIQDSDYSYADTLRYMGVTILKPESLCVSG